MCKPILPLVRDELAHIFWKAKHLATVHHHHGEHHAEEEVAEAEHEEKTREGPARPKVSEPVSVHIIVENFYTISGLAIDKQKFPINSFHVSTVCLEKNYPPPKHC